MSELLEVQLSRVILQLKEDHQFIQLTEKEGHRTFSILIGYAEAGEISKKLHRHPSPRPMTHDLITRLIDTLGSRIDRVIINDLKDLTFYATLVLVDQEGEKFVDCRPSDAIALAVQTRARIFVARKVLDIVAPE